MNDVLPDEAPLWERFEDTARDVFAQYGYRNIRVPIVEPTALFVRGIGEVTDVVEKEMYTFEDKLNGESLTLRPEATARHRARGDRAQPHCTTGRSACGLADRCSATSARRRAATGSSTSSTSRRSASRARTSTPSRS